MLSKPKQNLAWKQVAAVTAALQQSIRNELDAQDRIPNKWEELLRNRLVMTCEIAFPCRFTSASVLEDTKETCQLLSRSLMILIKSTNFELKFAILVPVTL